MKPPEQPKTASDWDAIMSRQINAFSDLPDSHRFPTESYNDSDVLPPPSVLRRASKEKLQRQNQLGSICKLLEAGLPAPGETIHIISGGTFDFWSFVPWLITEHGAIDEFYASTWTMNRACVDELLTLYDAGKIKRMSLLGGDYFKKRETAVFATLLLGMRTRNLRLICFKNHVKVMLIRLTTGEPIIIEGSANFTANPRMEQFAATQDESLYNFHRDWMEECLTTKADNQMSNL